jgi:predicted transcriptional regulator YdeE
MKPRLVKMSSLTCAGLSRDLEMPKDKHQIPALWAKLKSRMPEIRSICGPAMGVVTRSDKAGCINYTACIQIADAKSLPEDLKVTTIPSGDYVEFVHTGPVSTLFDTCNNAHRTWLPESGFSPDEGPMVEVYPENFRGDEENAEIRLLFSVK